MRSCAMALHFTKSGASSNENQIVYHSPVVRNHILYKARKSNEVFIKLHIKSIKYKKGLSHKEAAPKYKARLLRRVGLWRII